MVYLLTFFFSFLSSASVTVSQALWDGMLRQIQHTSYKPQSGNLRNLAEHMHDHSDSASCHKHARTQGNGSQSVMFPRNTNTCGKFLRSSHFFTPVHLRCISPYVLILGYEHPVISEPKKNLPARECFQTWELTKVCARCFLLDEISCKTERNNPPCPVVNQNSHCCTVNLGVTHLSLARWVPLYWVTYWAELVNNLWIQAYKYKVARSGYFCSSTM